MTCIFCGRDIETVPIKLPKTFTAYQLLQAGSGGCVQCVEMLRDPKFRRNCWVLKDGVFTVLEDPLAALLRPPEPPFVMYLTKRKRKHGWIVAVQNPALSRARFFVGFEERKVLVEPRKLRCMVDFAAGLRGRGVPKKVLLNGFPLASVVRKYGLTRGETAKLARLQYNWLWRVCVAFGP